MGYSPRGHKKSDTAEHTRSRKNSRQDSDKARRVVSRDRTMGANVRTGRADAGGKEAVTQAAVTGAKRRKTASENFGRKTSAGRRLFCVEEEAVVRMTPYFQIC